MTQATKVTDTDIQNTQDCQLHFNIWFFPVSILTSQPSHSSTDERLGPARGHGLASWKLIICKLSPSLTRKIRKHSHPLRYECMENIWFFIEKYFDQMQQWKMLTLCLNPALNFNAKFVQQTLFNFFQHLFKILNNLNVMHESY